MSLHWWQKYGFLYGDSTQTPEAVMQLIGKLLCGIRRHKYSDDPEPRGPDHIEQDGETTYLHQLGTRSCTRVGCDAKQPVRRTITSSPGTITEPWQKCNAKDEMRIYQMRAGEME